MISYEVKSTFMTKVHGFSEKNNSQLSSLECFQTFRVGRG